MPRYFLEISYNGTNYSGWQVQDNAISVQQKINESLHALLSYKTETIGCGRTDAGVHASQFFLHFNAVDTIESPADFLHSLNGILPFDIAAHTLQLVNDDAHARFDATQRTYRYFICCGKNVFMRQYAMQIFKPLQIELLNKCCDVLLQQKDFTSFCKSGAQNKTSDCDIKKAQWTEENGYYIFEITADRFLRGMVRAIVGTLLNVSSEKISLQDFKKILEDKDRTKAGASAPPQGLFLTSIIYPYLKIERPPVFPFNIN